MDVDGSSISSDNGGDIDQNLLLQFSCMNTTDRDELVRQMQKLLGPNLNSNTANFFLDMSNCTESDVIVQDTDSNRNLQAAICSYLDYTVPQRTPCMSLKGSQSPESAVGPGSSFIQTWSIANTGTDIWPGSCKLIQAGGEPFGAEPVSVPPLFPGHSTTLNINLVAPNTQGRHRGYFHLVTDKGEQIGDTLWAEITVESEITMALVQQLAALPIPSSRIDEATVSNYTQVPPQDDKMC